MAEAVVGESGDDMEMGVGNDLSGGAVVVHYYIYSVSINSFLDSYGDFFDNRTDVAKNFIGRAIDIFIMVFWDNQSVPGIIGFNIKESDKIFILIELAGSGGNFFLGDFAENTFVHKHNITLFAMAWQSVSSMLCIKLDCLFLVT